MGRELLHFHGNRRTIHKNHSNGYRRRSQSETQNSVIAETQSRAMTGVRKKVMVWVLTCLLMITAACGEVLVFANTQILDTDVSTPSEGCVFAGLTGTYYAEGQAALDRINEIRLEACISGNVPDPRDTSRMLTTEDYVPIRWSADLERIARIRAYESAVTVGHQRLNGKSIWSVSSNGIQSMGEVLAWNRKTGMINGINQWYTEKSDWVNKNTDTVTSHYTQMINPACTYVGLGCFCSSQAKYYNTTTGEYIKTNSELDTTMLDVPEGTVVQKIEVLLSALSNYQLRADKAELQIGETENLTLTAEAVYSGTSTTLSILDDVTYQSADSNIVSVSDNGVLIANNPGETNITALVNGTETASLKMIVNSPEETTATVAVSAVGKGSVSGGGTFARGTSVTVKATPESNQEFLGWYKNDQRISQKIEFTFTVEENTNLVGKFTSNVSAGWKQDSSGWWYQNSDGTKPVNTWQKINGKWYHFDEKGYMQTGWLKDNDSWYYLKTDGAMAVSTWIGEYYVDQDGKWVKGKYKEGWKQDSTGWWYQYEDGTYPKSTWKQINGKWYHFNDKGYMQTGWLKLNDTWYYLKSDGSMATGWLQVKSDWYYFNNSGAMAHDTWKGDYYLTSSGAMSVSTWIGKYYVGPDGKWVKDAVKG